MEKNQWANGEGIAEPRETHHPPTQRVTPTCHHTEGLLAVPRVHGIEQRAQVETGTGEWLRPATALFSRPGISLQFSFSGQSIPNRVDVKKEKGVKIYFDPVETAARVELNKPVVKQVYHDAENPATGPLAVFKPDAVEQLVWHVAAHEVGHAIYNLASVQVWGDLQSLMQSPERRNRSQ